MRRIDALFTARPFFGARSLARTLTEEGFPIDRKRVRRLMRLMGIEALGPKPRTTISAPGHKVYPYLLRGLPIEWPNQVWAAGISVPQEGRVRDGVWSPAIGLQERVANHRKRRWSKARVLRVTAGSGPHNLAGLRHMVLNVMQKDGEKGSLRGKFKRAGWDEAYLARLLTLF